MQKGGAYKGGHGGDEQVVEEASPISSRPPANLEEMMRLSADEGGGGGGGGGNGSGRLSGNRWPAEETLALLKIRSEMDSIFRDATVKGPLWEDVSRKLAELGYKRSAKKCKEKFENVQKYYKRTKEGRGGRQDGKTYKFFTQLEALYGSGASSSSATPTPHPRPVTPLTSTLDVAPLSVGISPSNTLPITMHFSSSSHMIDPPPASQPFSILPMTTSPYTNITIGQGSAPTTLPTSAPPATSFGFTFSSNSSSTASGSAFDDNDDDDDDDSGGDDYDDEDDHEMDVEPSSSRKRKRHSSKGGDRSRSSGSRRMMELFERLIRQITQKQEAMQWSFLERLEKREQEMMNREETWRSQEISRLAREHELMAQERAASASRDAAIVSLIQKITGQTFQLPPPITISTTPTMPPSPSPPPPPPSQPQPAAATRPTTIPILSSPLQQQQQMQQSHHQHQQHVDTARHQPFNMSSQLQPVMAIPEQQIPPLQHHQEMGASGSTEPASSRWPKAEVLALINLRTGLESKYQETGPKAPLWEEISAGMIRLGYNRSSKRCKEKWENINKYYKKVKESSKKRPEDAKTCPYYHQLDALYRNKVLGGSSSSFSIQERPQEQQSTQQVQEPAMKPADGTNIQAQATASESENKSKNGDRSKESVPGSLFGRESAESTEKPEDLVREMMEQQGMPQQQNSQEQEQLIVDDYEKIDEPDNFNLDQEQEDEGEYEDEDEDEDEDENVELEDGKMDYKIEFQQRNSGASNRGGGNDGAPSFLTMVQ